MVFALTISMDNAAFDDNSAELQDIMERLAVKLYGCTSGAGKVLDSNGNTVGTWSIR